MLEPLSDEYRDDPAATIAAAREISPLHYIESTDCYMAVTYDLVKELYTHPSFSNDRRYFKHYDAPEPGTYRHWSDNSSLFARTGDAHARVRRLGSFAFTPAAVRRQHEQIASIVDEFGAGLDGRHGDTVDLAVDYTQPIPNVVISRLLGVPPKGNDEQRFRQIAAAPLRLANPLIEPDVKATAEAAAEELIAYMRDLIEQRRAEPRDDIVTDLVQAYDANDQLTDDEVVLLAFALISAGTDTTTFASTYGLRALLNHPDQLELLQEQPDLLANAVMELLRFELGNGALPRYAMEDVHLAGHDISAGDLVFLSPLGAHRDPDRWPDPDRLDITRDTTDVVVFGHGPHYCMGANLAKGELRAIYGRALKFLRPESTLIDETYSGRSLMFTTLDSLVVRL